VPEIRRLFWRLVLAASQTIGQILDWSAWRAWQARLDACPQVGAFSERAPGLAFLPRLGLACHVGGGEIGVCGIRLVCLWWPMTGLKRFGGVS